MGLTDSWDFHSTDARSAPLFDTRDRSHGLAAARQGGEHLLRSVVHTKEERLKSWHCSHFTSVLGVFLLLLVFCTL